jgi:hypothetical protein
VDEHYHTTRYKEMPQWVQDRAIEVLRADLSPEVLRHIRYAYREHGNAWNTANLLHFTWGMAIRNRLRQAGLKDELLPEHNWDDYYAACCEVAADIRDQETGEIKPEWVPYSSMSPTS